MDITGTPEETFCWRRPRTCLTIAVLSYSIPTAVPHSGEGQNSVSYSHQDSRNAGQAPGQVSELQWDSAAPTSATKHTFYFICYQPTFSQFPPSFRASSFMCVTKHCTTDWLIGRSHHWWQLCQENNIMSNQGICSQVILKMAIPKLLSQVMKVICRVPNHKPIYGACRLLTSHLTSAYDSQRIFERGSPQLQSNNQYLGYSSEWVDSVICVCEMCLFGSH